MTRAYNTATTQQNSGGAVNPFASGKNKIINGDFGVWQRGTSFSTITSNNFTADRWKNLYINGTVNATRQTFTPGSAPVAGYEGKFFIRYDRTATHATNPDYWGECIEDVQTFAGQTVTLSFWAKASATKTLDLYLEQNFGTGGSGGVTTSIESKTLTTSWQRFTQTWTVPSISGKTIGTNSCLILVYRLLADQGVASVDFWGVQLEAGSIATPFQTATGTIAGELAACQRYYYRQSANSTNVYQRFSVPVGAASSTAVYSIIPTPVTMRTTYSSIDYTTTGLAVSDGAGSFINVTSLAVDASSAQNLISVTVNVASGLTTNRPYYLLASNSSVPYLGLSAEL